MLLHGTKFYCKQHHPPTITAYEAERDARWRKKWANQDAALERQIRIADATAKVIEAAKAWRAFDPGIDYEVEDNLLAAVDALLEAEK